jgi:hypothetical protein
MSARTNWKAMQTAGCKKPDYILPRDVKPRYMMMGSWHADLLQDGKRRPRKGNR